jgi:hypothetical protein
MRPRSIGWMERPLYLWNVAITRARAHLLTLTPDDGVHLLRAIGKSTSSGPSTLGALSSPNSIGGNTIR